MTAITITDENGNIKIFEIYTNGRTSYTATSATTAEGMICSVITIEGLYETYGT